MPAVMTYASLVDDITLYSERTNDATYIAQIPRIVMLAELDLAASWRGLGNQKWVTDAFTIDQPIVAKPAYWRETIAWNFGTGTGNATRNYLLERSLEYCRIYWPDPTVSSSSVVPLYYANYDWDNFFVAPTPAVAYPFELGYYERITPLDDANQTNWLTEHAPQLLLAACMLQAQFFLKWMGERLQAWQGMYATQAQNLGLEARNQTIDRSTAVDK